ncbi:tripartite tricarboxylate transporter substrate-binding protein [Roseomonas sp. CAU 1739]|uniref:Bug family tripartite tricarboxylate transporter substrate binding protein n=1 Tax=Roseomonas sp. CAU 1739 TaxID=3140364 RepID=UPI00325BC269
MTHRRSLIAATAALGVLPRIALAQQRFASLYMFVPAGPGGGWDGLGRAIEQAARASGLVGTLQFENVGGAGGMVGLPRFLQQRRGRADALMVGGSVMVGAALTNKTPISLQNTVAVARMTEEAGVIIVPANSPIQNIGQLADALKANPRAVSVAGGSAGGTDHIILGLMLQKLGRQPREASFVAFPGGGPAQAAILGGQVAAGISGWSEFSEQIKAGRVRALATTGERRLDSAVPTLKESGIDVVATNWRGVFGAPGINATQRQALVDLMTAIHATEAWRRILEDRGWEDAFLTGPAFDQFLDRDRSETEGVLKDLGLA